MSERKLEINELLRRRSLLAVNLFLLALVGWGFVGEFVRDRGLRQEIARLEAQASGLEVKNLEIAELGRKMALTDALERAARLNLGLRKPGESVIIVQDVQPPPARPAAVTEARPSTSNAAKWWRYFFHPNSQDL